VPSQSPRSREPSSNQSASSSSHSLSSNDLSSAFETDSAYSGDETDIEEEEMLAWPTASEILGLMAEIHPQALWAPVLTGRKRALVDRIMKDFWVIFKQEWSANIRTRTGSPSSSCSGPGPQSSNTSTKVSLANKKNSQREDDDDFSREQGDREPNNPGNVTRPKESQSQGEKFACPYRKHNPGKYSHRTRTWRTCALTSFDTVARVKYDPLS